MFGRAFLLSTFIVAVIFVSTLNATETCKEEPCDDLYPSAKKECTLNGKEVPCHTLQELSSRQKRSVLQKREELCMTHTCDGGDCNSNTTCKIDITTSDAPGVSGAPASPAALEATTTTASDSIKNGYGICLMVSSIFAYLFLN
uniref:Uncharacterized protein n=1 Tax=Panagrolaimus davidi TaxID=227884 RepID=A0A914QKQ2_9BILA